MNRFPWRWVLLGVVLSVALACTTAALWLTSTTDLMAFAAQAKAAGVSLDPVPPDQLAEAWWAARSGDLKDIPPYSNYEGDPPPSFAIACEVRFAHVGELAAQAPPGHIVSGGVLRPLNWWFRLRIRFAPDGELPVLVHQLRRNVELLRDLSDEMQPDALTLMEGMTDCLVLRWRELAVADRVACGTDLAAIAAVMEIELRSGEVRLVRRLYAAAWTHRYHLCRELLVSLPAVYQTMPGGPLLMERAGRRPLLAGLLAFHQAVSRSPDVRAIIRVIARERLEWRSLTATPWPTLYLRQQLQTGPEGLGMDHLACAQDILHIRLLAAELSGQPWPEDPFAPPGTPLHRVERDGALLGAWSVGEDGRPDGGKHASDVCMALSSEALGYPTMGDAPPPSRLMQAPRKAPDVVTVPTPPTLVAPTR